MRGTPPSPDRSNSDPSGVPFEAAGGPAVLLRAAVGGVLMGLANLVPGISGGTMLLAAGIYPRFISAIADVTTLRIRVASVLLLATVIAAAGTAIVLLAGPIKDLVVDHRWVMYSLFIGLTLGGVPVVWAMARPYRASVGWGALVGFAAMALLALAQARGAGVTGDSSNTILLFVAGLAGASAMILPGVSGGYLLLVLGQYVPILAAIDTFKDALQRGAWADTVAPATSVLLPVGLGVVTGVVAVSNLLRWLLKRFEKATIGVLLGLLLGAVVGLWPFQQTAEPVVGVTVVKGRILTVDMLESVAAEDFPTEHFAPSPGQAAAAGGFVLLGLAVTTAVARFGRERRLAKRATA